MASFGSSFQEVEARECVFYLVASWDPRFRQEQAIVSIGQIRENTKTDEYNRSIVIEDAKKAFYDSQNLSPAFFYYSRNIAEPTRSNPVSIVASIA